VVPFTSCGSIHLTGVCQNMPRKPFFEIVDQQQLMLLQYRLFQHHGQAYPTDFKMILKSLLKNQILNPVLFSKNQI